MYGLVSFIDEYSFGDLKSYKSQFSRLVNEVNFNDLKSRLAPVCKRTLRRQVVEYISYTNRIPITQEFIPTEEEHVLYEMVSEYLRRPSLQALPASQRSLMVLVMRKLLASSTFAIAGALNSLATKLKTKLREAEPTENIEEDIGEDFETLDEIEDEWEEEIEEEILTQSDINAIPKWIR